MITVTGAFLAERAGPINGNLCVWGGVLNGVQVDLDRYVRTTLVIITQRDRQETQRALQARAYGQPEEARSLAHPEESFTLDILRPDGSVDHKIIRVSPGTLLAPNGFVWADLLFEAEVPGIYRFQIRAGAKPDDFDAILSGLEIDDGPLAGAAFEIEVHHHRLRDADNDGPSRLV